MADYELVDRTERFHGAIIDVLSDRVTMPGGGVATRDWVRHPGAVAAVAVRDTGDWEVLLVRQYRHPVGRVLWELPAGLLDVEGESALSSARRELAEEADLIADRWHVLVDLILSPGCSDEAIRLFLARDLRPVPAADRFDRQGEEATMTTEWLPLDKAVDLALAGEIENASSVAGVLAAARVRDRGEANLRPADADWPSRPGR